MQTKIYSLGFGGEGIGKIDGKVAFIKNALPDELVDFKILKNTKKYLKGIATDIINKSSARINPVCKYYVICGGCQYQHLSYEKELFYKSAQVKDIFERIGKLRNINISHIISDKEYNYRNTVTLHRGINGFGFFSDDNKTVINIDYCYLLNDTINDYLSQINNVRKSNIKIKTDNNLNIYTDIKNKYFINNILNHKLYFSSKAFSQTNTVVAEKILIKINEHISSDTETTLFDAYSGSGLFTYLIKGNFNKRIGIEEEPFAIGAAKKNKNLLKNQVFHFINAKTEDVLFDVFNKYKSKRNILILDPPRTGLNNQLALLLSKKKLFDEIYYLSCYPPALARDLNIIFSNNNYSLRDIYIFDMFPRTKHIEVLVSIK